MLSKNGYNRFIDKLRLKRVERQMISHPNDWKGYYQVLKSFQPRSLEHKIYLNQIWNEWNQFINFLCQEQRAPKRILEIGTGRGGSTYYFTKLAGGDALVITVDAEPLAGEFVSLFSTPRSQKIYSLIASSHDPSTVDKVAGILQEEPVDLLYIDGDHSYEGVKKDFELYKEFCAPGSIICFHDINPDHGVTRGIQTEARSGEVYKFWNEIKPEYEHFEIIESPGQDGFGIGVLKCSN